MRAGACASRTHRHVTLTVRVGKAKERDKKDGLRRGWVNDMVAPSGLGILFLSSNFLLLLYSNPQFLASKVRTQVEGARNWPTQGKEIDLWEARAPARGSQSGASSSFTTHQPRMRGGQT